MTASAILGLVLALGLVLGLFGLALGAARRLAGGRLNGRSTLPLTVLQRTALGPRQGLALVRVADRVLLVSVGDGGVRLVAELTAAEAARAGVDPVSRSDTLAGDARATRAAPPSLAARGLRAMGLLSALLAFTLTSTLRAAPLHAATLSPSAARSAPAVTALQSQRPAAGAPGGAPNPQPAGSQVNASAVTRAAAAALQPQGNAPQLSLQVGNGQDSDLKISGTVGSVLFIGMLALLPMMLLLMTSFTRVLVVLHFLRQALGTQGAPPAQLLTALALLLSGFIMAPTLAEVNTAAVQPWMNGQLDEGQMMKAGVEPFRAFMLRQTPEADLAHFVEMSGQVLPDQPEQVSLPVLMSAFATSELRAAFQMGFALFLPFVVIDIVVSAVLTSMGMFMLPPTMIALPCKLLLFVLVDGWSLLVGSLVASFR